MYREACGWWQFVCQFPDRLKICQHKLYTCSYTLAQWLLRNYSLSPVDKLYTCTCSYSCLNYSRCPSGSESKQYKLIICFFMIAGHCHSISQQSNWIHVTNDYYWQYSVSPEFWPDFFLIYSIILLNRRFYHLNKFRAPSTFLRSGSDAVLHEPSLLAEASFPLYSLNWRARGKETSALGRNGLWFNRRP